MPNTRVKPSTLIADLDMPEDDIKHYAEIVQRYRTKKTPDRKGPETVGELRLASQYIDDSMVQKYCER